MQSDYVFTEHSPSTTTYIRSGRGGAGNTFRASNSTSSPPPSSTSTISTSSSSSAWIPRRFFSGIGGAGNVHEADQMRRPALLRSLELESPVQQGNPPVVGYVGRGGAGNVYRSSSKPSSRGSDSDACSDACSLVSSAGSTSSSLSAKAKAWAVRVTSH